MNNIETRPIGKLIRNDSTPNRTVKVEHYSIPSYQSGKEPTVPNASGKTSVGTGLDKNNLQNR